MTTISAQRLAKVFVEVADTLVDEFDLIDFLHMLTDRTATLVGASTVGLLLADQRGQLQFMAASDENTELLELFQVQNREGPCLDAYHTAQPVINADLRQAETRWPRFAPRATAAGFRSSRPSSRPTSSSSTSTAVQSSTERHSFERRPWTGPVRSPAAGREARQTAR